MKQCQSLLEESDIEAAVRIGDVYAFIIDHFVRKEKYKAVSCWESHLPEQISSSATYVYMYTCRNGC